MRPGYKGIKIKLKVKSDAPKEKLEELVRIAERQMDSNPLKLERRSRSFTSSQILYEQSGSVTFLYIFVRYCVRKLSDFGTIALLACYGTFRF